ncbi:hypothetical protein E1294_40120 [Nonomuraea diastatica]|uniref:Uncharacterized protein n=1 Tax=Nonomuraea diastatica TaxID=1848329 RepID=A0A4V2YD11_9ACTN|nr:hypothetical protein E1294_40120 [Nonomuraea diastatica]
MIRYVYVRFQSPAPNARGVHPGVFGLINVLAKHGQLSPEEERFKEENHAWFHANLVDPSDVDPHVYGRTLNPKATAWFKSTATHLLERLPGYLAILAAHGVACVRVEEIDPGTVIYDDPHQVVVVPYATG